MKSIKFSRNLTIILSTIIALFLLYFLYVQVYTKNREEKLIQTRFRVLDQMGDNLKTKINSYRQNATSYWRQAKESVEKNDLLINNLEEKEWVTKTIQKTFDEYKTVLNQELEYSPDPKRTLSKKLSDSTVQIKIVNNSMFIHCGPLPFYLSNENLMKNIERPDVFTKSLVLVIDDTKNVFCSLGDDVTISFVDQPKGGRQGLGLSLISRKTSDTLLIPVKGEMKSALIRSSNCYDIVLADGAYKLFIKSVKVNDLSWFIGGMVRSSDFQREKQSIAPWFIILLSLALLLIILSLPFVKLRVLSQTEMLQRSTMFQVAVSLLLGVSFLVFCLFFQAHYLSRINDTDSDLGQLSDSLSSKLNEELRQIYNVVSMTDSMMFEKSKQDSLVNVANVLLDPEWKTDPYPYFDYIFRLDPTGWQVAQISPFANAGSLQDLSFRDYFKKYDEWAWSFEDTGNATPKVPENLKFRMESIVSVTGGDYKVAFATGSKSPNSRIVLTGRFYSLIDPIIPKDYGFCIIDNTGKCWFHSNKSKNMAENFLEECDNDKSLRAAMYADISTPLTVDYYNNPHRIFIRRMESLPLYLVTFHDLRFEYSYQAQTFLTTSLLIAGLFIYLFLQLMLLLLFKKLNWLWEKILPDRLLFTGIKNESLLVEFSMLGRSKNNDYKYIIIIMLLSIMPLYALIFQMSPHPAILAIFITATALQTILFKYLHLNKCNSNALKIYTAFNTFVFYAGQLALFILIFSYHYKTAERLYILLFLLCSALLFNIVLLPRAKKFSAKFLEKLNRDILKPFKKIDEKIRNFSIKPDTTYSIMILALILVFGVIPGLKFFNIATNLENEVQIRNNQLELIRAQEIRNTEFQKYYLRIKNPPGKDKVDKAHSNRLKSGIFTSFYASTLFLETPTLKSGSSNDLEHLNPIINMFRPVYRDPLSVYSKYLYIDTTRARAFNWRRSNDTIELVSSRHPVAIDEESNPSYKAVISIIPKTRILMPFQKNVKMRVLKTIAFFILFAVILYLIFRLIIVTTRRLFEVSLIEVKEPPDLELNIKEKLDAGFSVLLVNPSGFIGFDNLKAKISALIPEKKKLKNEKGRKFQLIDKLFYNYQDPVTLDKQIEDALKHLYAFSTVIVVSDIHPHHVLNYYKVHMESKPAELKAENKTDGATDNYRKTYEKLKMLLKNFQHIEVSLESPGLNVPESTHEHYYHSILDNCTPEEIYVLVDLANDSLINYKNKFIIQRLVKRGLIRPDGDDLGLMQEGFGKYLISHYSRIDRQKLKKEMGAEPSHWAGFRLAIVLVIIALFVFIFISNQDFLNNINRLFITLGASIAGISSLFNMTVKKNN